MHICLFEDEQVLNFEPLTYSRPVYELICGASTLREKILKYFPGLKYSLFCREYLKKVTEEANPGIMVNDFPSGVNLLFINGRLLPDGSLADLAKYKGADKVFKKEAFTAAAFISASKADNLKGKPFSTEFFYTIPSEEIAINYADYIWDLIYSNKAELNREIKDIITSASENINGSVYEGVHFVAKDNVYISEGAKVKPGTVIDASSGPVFIGRNSVIYPNSVIEGPVYIGESTLIKALSKIYEGVSIGSTCKVGGEVEDAIIMSYSNKQHEGFLGHAYLGSWVNLGADTNCSDLRNNYGFIKVHLNGKDLNSGKQFLGLIMGDHSKTGINTMFNTGTIAGFSCNIFGAGFPDKYIPSFGWGGKESMETYDVNKALDTAKKVMARRNKILSSVDEELFMCIFALTKEERLVRGFKN